MRYFAEADSALGEKKCIQQSTDWQKKHFGPYYCIAHPTDPIGLGHSNLQPIAQVPHSFPSAACPPTIQPQLNSEY